APSDSPFDRLERARSFFTSYVLALLRLYRTDSRVINVHLIDPIATLDAHPEITDLDGQKVIADARRSIEEARKLSSEGQDRETLKAKLKTLDESLVAAQKAADAAILPLGTAFAEVSRTLKELTVVRAEL